MTATSARNTSVTGAVETDATMRSGLIDSLTMRLARRTKEQCPAYVTGYPVATSARSTGPFTHHPRRCSSRRWEEETEPGTTRIGIVPLNRWILRAEANRSKDATKELETPDLELGPWKSAVVAVADAKPRKGPSEFPLTSRAVIAERSDELYGAVEHVKSGWVMHECKGLWPIWSIYG
uniref:Uncharacterized protein n=1 Tax=Vespula pensylvanica TaxID=30213 RepID=A0A834NIF4_VESPE|nr:hypothetical protein H0235_013204 [Vespula pensylvanica]